ncbi:MAG: CoA pyrophosphatase [Chitinispirillaceae bacterium]|nr:CoA pyrophosphatase [Chitinispirillaceae bacterium]
MNNEDLKKLYASLQTVPAIIGRRNFTDAAVIVPLLETGDEYHLLFEKRSPDIPQGSEICFPGGEFDAAKDRSLRDTALRETAEELGIDRRRIEVIGALGTVLAIRGIAVDCFPALMRIGSLDELSIDRAEVERVFTLPVSWFGTHPPRRYPLRVEMRPRLVNKDGGITTLFPARELGLPEKYRRSWHGKDRTVPVYRTEQGPVWGMTAEIVEELVRRWRDRA